MTQDNTAAKPTSTTRGKKGRDGKPRIRTARIAAEPKPDERAGEIYTPQRIAEFHLSNAVSDPDYERAKEEVRKLGLDPASIPHYNPPGRR